MADYFAVLNRTLSGFSDPKPALREKLYDRARSTIRKQLDMRRPAMDDAGIEAEMVQLEDAIARLEGGYSAAVPAPAEPSPTEDVTVVDGAPDAEGAADSSPSEDGAVEPVDIPDAAADAVQDADAAAVAVTMVDEPPVDLPDPVETPQIDAEDVPVFDKTEPLSSAADEADVDVPVFDPPALDLPVGDTFEPQPLDPSVTPDAPAFDAAVATPDVPEVAGFDAAVDEATSLGDVVATNPTESEPEVAISEPLPATSERDPLDAWADEFLAGNDEGPVPREEESSSIIPSAPVAVAAAAAVAAPAAVSAATSPPPPPPPADSAPPLPPVGEGEPLTIPPAPDVERGGRPTREKKKSGFGFVGWLLLILVLILLLLIGAAFAVPQAAPYRDAALERLGLTSTLGPLFGLDNPATPTPVKTITITPEAEPEETTAPEPEPAPQVVTPKDEDRLTQSEPEPRPVTPVIEPLETVPSTDPAPETATPAAIAGASAILYEEGTTGAANQNSFNAGKVSWSLGSEAPVDGGPEEPVINARIEIPERKLVLLMSIKRNADPALPASHVIELVFATPDDFTGGAIADINRFVLKESEQGRGDNLIGVPARIDDGIFLIALNNLESARTANVSLLRSRDWIDIPLEYRTGRRALMTMEKGEDGQKVFADAFAAWDGLGG